jgi:hypothetical protein
VPLSTPCPRTPFRVRSCPYEQSSAVDILTNSHPAVPMRHLHHPHPLLLSTTSRMPLWLPDVERGAPQRQCYIPALLHPSIRRGNLCDCTTIHDTRIYVATNPSVPLWYALYVSRYFRLHPCGSSSSGTDPGGMAKDRLFTAR